MYWTDGLHTMHLHVNSMQQAHILDKIFDDWCFSTVFDLGFHFSVFKFQAIIFCVMSIWVRKRSSQCQWMLHSVRLPPHMQDCLHICKCPLALWLVYHMLWCRNSPISTTISSTNTGNLIFRNSVGFIQTNWSNMSSNHVWRQKCLYLIQTATLEGRVKACCYSLLAESHCLHDRSSTPWSLLLNFVVSKS